MKINITKYTLFFVLMLGVSVLPVAATASSLYIEELTTADVRDQLHAGATTVLIPIGGTEQNGPLMVIGKHNIRAHLLAGLIAKKLGNTLIAPVLSYVPEGKIAPPAAHMRFAGTISISDAAFESLLESAARSFKQHGFKQIVFIGDHGGYQTNLQHVATKLNKEWAHDSGIQVVALLEYYRVTQTSYVAELKNKGFTADEIGTHAGLADTSLSLALDKSLVRTEALANSEKPGEQQGVYGDPRRASAELGEIGVALIVDASVAAIRAAMRLSKPGSRP